MAEESKGQNSFMDTLMTAIGDFMGGFASKDPSFGAKRLKLMEDIEEAKQQRKQKDMQLKLMQMQIDQAMEEIKTGKIPLQDLIPKESDKPSVAGGVGAESPDVNYGVPETEPVTKPGEFKLENLLKGGTTVGQFSKIAPIFSALKKEEPESQLIERPEGLWRVPKKGTAGKVEGVPGKEETTTPDIKNYQFDMKQRKASGLGEITFKEWGEEKEEIKRLAAKEKTPPSAGNAVDLAIKRKFGTEHLTDPKKVAEADKWLATPDGRKAVQNARDDLTPPSYVFPFTAEGIVPLKSKGEGAGKVPEGLGKPLPSEMVTFEGQVNQIKEGLKTVRNLYKKEYVGPVQGAIGTTKEKLGGIDEGQAMFYAKMQEISNVIVYLYSGKQINENEYKRLMSSLPHRYLPDVTFETRMKGFEETLDSITSGRKGGMGGYGSKSTQENKKEPNKRFRYNPSTGKLEEIK